MKVFCRLVSFLVLISATFIAYALPPGSYLQTCQRCSVSTTITGSNLYCTCQDSNQNPTFSVLNNVSQCGYVVNNNGQLYCQQQTNGSLPPGSYLQTCQSCQLNGNQLSCQCLTNNQYRQSTSLFNASNCSWVVNNNGQLYCQQQATSALPPGSYLQTCQSCQLNGNQLSCQCLTKNQYRQPTSLFNATNCSWIINNNGYLQCSNQSLQPHAHSYPAGSYLKTCNACSFNGYMISCNCKRSDGSWSYSSLSITDSCSNVQNLDGQLTCSSGGQ